MNTRKCTEEHFCGADKDYECPHRKKMTESENDLDLSVWYKCPQCHEHWEDYLSNDISERSNCFCPKCHYPITVYYLEFKSNDVILRQRLNRGNKILVGRNYHKCDFVLKSEFCARIHAIILYNENKRETLIMDLGAKNGTYINGKKLESEKWYQLKKGDEVSFSHNESYKYCTETL